MAVWGWGCTSAGASSRECTAACGWTPGRGTDRPSRSASRWRRSAASPFRADRRPAHRREVRGRLAGDARYTARRPVAERARTRNDTSKRRARVPLDHGGAHRGGQGGHGPRGPAGAGRVPGGGRLRAGSLRGPRQATPSVRRLPLAFGGPRRGSVGLVGRPRCPRRQHRSALFGACGEGGLSPGAVGSPPVGVGGPGRAGSRSPAGSRDPLTASPAVLPFARGRHPAASRQRRRGDRPGRGGLQPGRRACTGCGRKAVPFIRPRQAPLSRRGGVLFQLPGGRGRDGRASLPAGGAARPRPFYLVAVEGMAEHLFRLAGLPDPVPMFGPLARTALETTLTRGPEAALTGPAVRGDAGTVRRNLEALSRQAPQAVAPYVALARLAADLAASSGRLTAQGYARLREELDEWK